jgi:transposase
MYGLHHSSPATVVSTKTKGVHTTISLDLAKIVIQVCHIDRQAEILFNKPMSPEKTEQFLVQAKPCVVAMEGCGSFHHWARLAQKNMGIP